MEKAYQHAQFDYRKQDARRKIELGGLVIKADLHNEPKDVILGALISAVETLAKEPESRGLFQSKGMRAFLKLDD